MKILQFLSEFTIPLVMFYIVGYGLLQKKNVYEYFITGAGEGLKIVLRIMPTQISLKLWVCIQRSSCILEIMVQQLRTLLGRFGFPAELVPLVLIRMFSSSAATGLCLDIFKEFGPDSCLGMITSIMMGCTETIFYTMSVYFMTARVKKTRYTLAGSLLATLAGIAVSVLLGRRLAGMP